MIRYQLVCDHVHEFESWFRSSDDFDRQSASGHLSCPICGSDNVKKALMAPSLSTARKAGPPLAGRGGADQELPPTVTEMQKKLREMRAFVTENSEYVGDRFATVARDMHYRDEPERGIYGEAKLDDVRDLRDEGIAVVPLPALPEEKN